MHQSKWNLGMLRKFSFIRRKLLTFTEYISRRLETEGKERTLSISRVVVRPPRDKTLESQDHTRSAMDVAHSPRSKGRPQHRQTDVAAQKPWSLMQAMIVLLVWRLMWRIRPMVTNPAGYAQWQTRF